MKPSPVNVLEEHPGTSRVVIKLENGEFNLYSLDNSSGRILATSKSARQLNKYAMNKYGFCRSEYDLAKGDDF